MNIPNLRKKLLTRRTVFVALLALVLCALAALIAFCLPRAIEPTIPEAPPTRAPTLTATPTIHPTITWTPTNTATNTMTPSATSSPTLIPTETLLSPTPTTTNTFIPTPIVGLITTPGRNGTMPTTGAATPMSNEWLVILGVVLLALGFWIYDAASKDNPTW